MKEQDKHIRVMLHIKCNWKVQDDNGKHEVMKTVTRGNGKNKVLQQV